MLIEQKELDVDPGKIVEVSGPAAVRVVKGRGSLLGRELTEGDFVIVPQWRTYAIVSKDGLKLNIALNPNAEVRIVDYNVIVEWEKVLRDLDAERVVVLGPTDSGKSSVTTILVNLNVEKGKEIDVINTDVGQSNFCLPTTVCKAKLSSYVFTLNDLEPVKVKFTGTITPAVEQSRVISSIASLIEGPYIMDTDGWVDGYEAGAYKRALLEAVKPDAVVYMGNAPWWTKGPWKVISLPPSPGRERSREDRRSIRREKYRRALEKCRTIDIDLNEVTPLYSMIFNSPQADESLYKMVEELIGAKPILVVPKGRGVIAVVKKGSKYRKVKEVTVIEEGEERGLLVGLGDKEGNEHLGELIKANYLLRMIKVRTCFEGKPEYVSFGRVKLDEEWRDSICRKPF